MESDTKNLSVVPIIEGKQSIGTLTEMLETVIFDARFVGILTAAEVIGTLDLVKARLIRNVQDS